MLQINARRIYSLQSPGGDAFTKFVEDPIRTDGSIAGTPESAIETNLRTNLPDGGADTVVRQPDPHDRTGRLRMRTVWQHKGTTYKNVGSTATLLKSQFVVERIKEGFAFRLAIADSLPSSRRAKRTEELTKSR